MSRRAAASRDGRTLAALVADVRVRVLNCSATGCLLASATRVEEGTVATLHLRIGERTFTEVVKVVRCEPLDPDTGRYQVGARFLSTSPAYPGSLRYAMGPALREVAGRLETDGANSGTKVSPGTENQNEDAGSCGAGTAQR
jgi:hypothetical protein